MKGQRERDRERKRETWVKRHTECSHQKYFKERKTMGKYEGKMPLLSNTRKEWVLLRAHFEYLIPSYKYVEQRA